MMSLFRFLKVTCLILPLTLAPWRAAQAEIDLGSWNTYATMAEQGAVCGAFADIMAMQELVDAKLGRLWAERRNYAGSVVMRAAELEGRGDVDDQAVDELLARYSMWLLNNLAAEESAEILSPTARDAARDMVADVCNALYQQADRAIVAKHPALASCTPDATDGQAPLSLSSTALAAGTASENNAAAAKCDVNDALLAAATVKKAEQNAEDMMLRLREEEVRRRQAQDRAEALQSQMAGLRAEIDALQTGAEAARNTAERAVELNLSNEQLRDRVSLLGKEVSRLNDLVTDMNAVTARNTELTAEAEQLNMRVVQLQASLDEARGEIALLHTPAELDGVRAEIAELTKELDRTRGERDDAVAAFDNALDRTLNSTITEQAVTSQNESAGVISAATARPASEGATAATTAGDNMTLLAADLATSALPATGTMPEVASAATETNAVTADSDHKFVVQLGAFQSRTGAVTEIAALQQSFEADLADAGLNIRASKMQDGSNLFRIMTGNMSADSARQLCSLLWERMVGCVVKPVP